MQICEHRETDHQDLLEIHEQDLRHYYFNRIGKNLPINRINSIILMQ